MVKALKKNCWYHTGYTSAKYILLDIFHICDGFTEKILLAITSFVCLLQLKDRRTV